MLKVKHEKQGETLILYFSGDILEDVDFPALVGTTAPHTVLNCKEVVRINSLGVKRWIQYFEPLKEAGTHLRFVECSPAIVEQINMIRNFICGGTVESIYVPFVCPQCKKSVVSLFQVNELRQSGLKLPDVKCQSCPVAAVFDDLIDEYFQFMSR